MICKLFYITGKVQGVFFRASAQAKANELDIDGYVKNLPDGGVEVLACGGMPALRKLEDWLWEGPKDAVVDKVDSFVTKDIQKVIGFAIH